MLVRHFLLYERLRTYQTFENLSNLRPKKNVEQTWVLNAPTFSDRQMLNNNVGTCIRAFMFLATVSYNSHSIYFFVIALYFFQIYTRNDQLEERPVKSQRKV